MQQVYSCPNCHSPVQRNTRFCVNCGISLSWSSPSSGQQAQGKSSKELDKIGCFNWLLALFQIRGEAAPIIQSLSQVHNGSNDEKYMAFSVALQNLPSILERLKTIPQLEGINMEKLRGIQALEVNALDSYITSCQLSIEHLKNPSSVGYSAIEMKVARASEYWGSSAREVVAFLRKLRLSAEESETILRMSNL